MSGFISTELPRDGLCPTCRKPVTGWQVIMATSIRPLRVTARVEPLPGQWLPCGHDAVALNYP